MRGSRGRSSVVDSHGSIRIIGSEGGQVWQDHIRGSHRYRDIRHVRSHGGVGVGRSGTMGPHGGEVGGEDPETCIYRSPNDSVGWEKALWIYRGTHSQTGT